MAVNVALPPEPFLRELHPNGSFFSLCAFAEGQPPCFEFYNDVDRALAHAAKLDAAARFSGVHFLVPDLATKPARGRGTEADAAACRAVWVDTDAVDFEPLASRIANLVAQGNLKEKAAKSRVWAEASPDDHIAAKSAAAAAVDAAIASEKIPPFSARVDSGRGWHYYWLLREPATGDHLRLLKGVNRKLGEIVGGDTTGDLARVLRLPGTANRKDRARPIPSTLVFFDRDRRYALADLVALTGARPEALRGDSAEQAPPTNGAKQREGAAPSGKRVPPAAWFVFMGRTQKAMASWSGARVDLRDQSRSGYANSLAELACVAGIRSAEDILAILAQAPSTATLYIEKPETCRYTVEKALAGAPPVDDAPDPKAAERLAVVISELPPGPTTWTWLGFHAARANAFDQLVGLAPDEESRRAAVDGRDRAASKSDTQRPAANEALCRKAVRALRATTCPSRKWTRVDETATKTLDVEIVSLARRRDSEGGTGSRTTLVLRRAEREAQLLGLRGRELVDWRRIRALAAEEGLDLPTFAGADAQWAELLAEARAEEVVTTADEDESPSNRIVTETRQVLATWKRGATAQDLKRSRVIEREADLLVLGRQLFRAGQAALEEKLTWDSFLTCMKLMRYSQQRPLLEDGLRPRCWAFPKDAIGEEAGS